MKHFIISALLLSGLCLTLGSCKNQSTNNQAFDKQASTHTEHAEKQLIGNAKDDHGCLVSAGYSWSEALKDCVRIWEVGEKLQNTESEEDVIFIVFSKDRNLVEVHSKALARPTLCLQAENLSLWLSEDNMVRIESLNGKLQATINQTLYKATE